MWVFTNHGFISIVGLENSPSDFLVQSHFPNHIESFFPNAQVTEKPGTIYRLRTRSPSIRCRDPSKLEGIDIRISELHRRSPIPDHLRTWATWTSTRDVPGAGLVGKILR